MRWSSPSNWSLGGQFLAVLTAATVLLVVLVGELAARRDRSYLRVQTERQYAQLLDVLQVTATDAIAAEDISLLKHLVSGLGKSDSSLHTLEILNADGRVLVRWIRPLSEDAETFAPSVRRVVVEGQVQGSVRAVVDLTPALVEVSARAQATRIAMTVLLLLLALTVGGMVYRLAVLPLAAIDARLLSLREGELRDDFQLDAALEFRHLASAINGFARQIRERQETDAAHRDELRELNRSYLRFVPKQFLDFLDRDSIVTVQHGDQVQRTMTVLFSDIRSFTELSEEVGAEGTFSFINDYLTRMGPAVRANNGFIDKYIGDAIMALFDSPVDAVQAGVDMLRTLAELNAERAKRGEKLIRIGIGLNTGPLMLGIIGEDLRMEGTVIGDAVNLAARLETLTKKYQVPLLISEDTLRAVEAAVGEDGFDEINRDVRFVDSVTAKGRSTKTQVYEVFAADAAAVREVKREHSEIFGRVLRAEVPAAALRITDSSEDPLVQTYRRIAAVSYGERKPRKLEVDKDFVWE